MNNKIFGLLVWIFTGPFQISPMLVEINEPNQNEAHQVDEPRLVVFEVFMGG